MQVAAPEDLVWLGAERSPFAAGEASAHWIPRTPTAARLAQLDALNQDSHVLREGWVFLSGTVVREGNRVPVLIPLISRPVRLASESAVRTAARAMLVGGPTNAAEPSILCRIDGEVDLIPLVEDADLRAELTDRAEFGRGAFSGQPATPALVRRMPALDKWVQEVAHAAGLTSGARIPVDTQDPRNLVGHIEGLRAVIGGAIYVAVERPRPVVASALAAWSKLAGIERTSFGALYADPDDGREPAAGSVDEVLSPLVLSPSQARLVAKARIAPLTVVSGAPGNGKTHAVAAVALDHVAEGRSVLIATRSRFAARAIADLIHRVPGPNALRFGDIVEGSSVVDELNDHLLDHEPTDASADLERAIATRNGVRAEILAALEMEVAATEGGGPVAAMRVLAPLAFDPSADLVTMAALAEAAAVAPRGWFGRRRHRRALRDLASAVGAPVTDVAAVTSAIERARRHRLAFGLSADGGTVIGSTWDRLAAAEDDVRLKVGSVIRERQDHGRRARGAVAELLAALRAGRGKRRQLLSKIDTKALTAAVPLWIGTLSDIEDLLPARAGLFDLVILDEAAHIDQAGAAPALLRAERAVVVGDPRQLRHVSFLSDDAIDAAMAEHGISHLTTTVDLRRNSVFDRAATVAPVFELSEHYRSIPHLVEFPLAEFYRGRVDVMTHRPDTDTLDAIDVVVPPAPGRAAEVAATVELLRSMVVRPPGGSVGVVSPFREHADALEAAVLEHFDEAEIRALDLRVGTVHGFQGSERDTMVLALGLSPDDPSGRVGFVENRNLFNVMVTRARNRAVVLTTVTDRSDGLLARFLAHADRAPDRPADGGADDAWTRSLAVELARAGIATRSGYPLGPWRLDLVLDDTDEAIVFETRVDGGDPRRHIDRHLTLARLGWRFVEAYPTRWDHDVARAALELPALIDAARRSTLPPPPPAPATMPGPEDHPLHPG
jgi:hypothetical protein